jgi:hypothetical protein
MTQEQFDWSDMEDDFAGAGGRDRSEKFIPPTGPATAMITGAKMRAGKDGTPTLNWSLKLLDGENTGETIWRNNRIVKGDAKSFNRLNSDLLTAGVKLEKLEQLNDQTFLDALKGKVVAVSIKVTDATKGFYDVYINRRISAEDLANM